MPACASHSRTCRVVRRFLDAFHDKAFGEARLWRCLGHYLPAVAQAIAAVQIERDNDSPDEVVVGQK